MESTERDGSRLLAPLRNAEPDAPSTVDIGRAVRTGARRVRVRQGLTAAVAGAIPLTYFLDAYRSHYGFASEFAHPVTTGLVLSAGYAALAHWAFFASIQSARRSGQLLKMSE